MILTFAPVDPANPIVPPTINSDYRSWFSPNQAPLCFNFTTDPGATVELLVLPVYVSGSGKLVDKSYSAQGYVNGGQLCITDSGGIGTRFYIFAVATANSTGAANFAYFTSDVVKKK